MYKIELTTNDNRETLLKELYCDTWKDTYKKLKELQRINLDAFIKIYNCNNMEYLGDFTNIKATTRKKPKKQKHWSNWIIFIELLLFPIMLVKEISKEL